MVKIGIVIAVVLSIIGAAFFFVTNTKPEITPEKETITEGAFAPDMDQSLSGSGSFMSLLGLGKNLQCAMSYAIEGGVGQFDGVAYISGEKTRVNFTVSTAVGNMDMSVIHNGSEGYTWGSSPMGNIAQKFSTEETRTSTTANQQFSLQQEVVYSCKNWNVDTSYFIPPADINFTEVETSVQMGASASSNVNLKEMQCNACAQITDVDAQAQCRQALSCN